MDDDWDLHAVVRGCAATVTTTTVSTAAAAAATSIQLPSYHDDQNSFDFSGLGDDSNEGLQEIYQDFYFDDPPLPTAAAASDISAATIMSAPPPLALQPHQNIMQVKPPLGFNMQIQENVQFNINSNLPIRPRRRKNQQTKFVRQMTQEEISADSWAWRKYGQKPIKGSPYPRNYYRCSTSKGCAARKQVERSPNDPQTFVVSYSGEHTHPRPAHRSSLAGITRSILASPAKSGANNPILSQKGTAMAASSSSSSAALSFSPDTPSMEGEAAAQNGDVRMAEEEDDGDEDEENMIMISTDLMNDDDDDTFRGFRDSDDHSSGGFFSGGLLSSPPWTPTSSAATFNGGGGG